MEAPKGLAKALVRYAMDHPELELQARWYPQLPGRFAHSRSALFPLENMYRSLPLLPWWHYEGFRVVGAGAIFYHEVLSRFSLRMAAHDFGSPRAAVLVLAAAVDASLNGPASRREDLPVVDDLLLRLRHAVATLAGTPNREP